MVAVRLLVPLAVAVVVVAMVLHGRSTRGSAAEPRRAETDDGLAAVLRRAAYAGVITADQAEAVLAGERARQAATPRRAPARVPAALEALGYLGGTLIMAGLVTLVSRFWDDLAPWARLTFVGTVAVALTVGGLLITDEEEPVLWRLRGFLLLLGTGAVAGFTGLLLVDTFDVRDEPVVLAIGLVVAAHAGLLWWRSDRPAQHAACFGGVLATVVGALAWTGRVLDWTGNGPGPIGVAIWLIGALWLAASLRHLLPPEMIGIALGAAAALASGAPMAASWKHAGVLVGLATATALIAAGVQLDEFELTGFGVLGMLVYLPVTVNVFFADTIGVPAVMLMSGLAMLALAVWLFRQRGHPRGLVGHRPA